MEPILLGLSSGVLLVYMCMVLVARKVTRRSIVDLIRSATWTRNGQSRYGGILRQGIAILVCIVCIGFTLFTNTESFREIIHDDVKPLIIGATGLLNMISVLVVLIFTMKPISAWIDKMLAPFPRASLIGRLALRHAEVHRVRTALLLIMFAAVLFLTGFAGVFGNTSARYFGSFDARVSTGGYDLTATKEGALSNDELEALLRESRDVRMSDLEQSLTVAQYVVPRANLVINGIDTRFADTVDIPLIERDARFASDREVWRAAAADPDVMIVSESDLKREGRSYGIGDRLALRLGDRVIEKTIVGIAQYRNENFGYHTASGYWIQKEELLEHVDGSSSLQTALLFRVADPQQLPKVAKDLERCLTLLNIYPLVNPQEISVVGSSFVQTIFGLFESFSSLAALIGCIGLMIVMYRIVIERRRQFGMLRAIGVLPRMISGSMILEGAIIGFIGMMLGLVMGSYTGYLMIETLSAAGEVPPQEFPYGKFGLYAAAGLALTLLCTALPARNIMRLHPAEATRYVEG
jgi:hypothetical protein